MILHHELVAIFFGNSRAEKTTKKLQFLFFARVGVKIRKGIPRYLRVLRKMPFNGIEITFSIHGNEGMSVTRLTFQRFFRSLVIFRPFSFRFLFFSYNYCCIIGVFTISVTISSFSFNLHVVLLLYVPVMVFCILY